MNHSDGCTVTQRCVVRYTAFAVCVMVILNSECTVMLNVRVSVINTLFHFKNYY